MTQLCTFHVADLFFGLDVRHVQEVIRYQHMTSVPLASKVVRGLINLRGQIVTAIDMRGRLDLPAYEGEELPMNVVLMRKEAPVSLLVDRIGDVIEVDPAQLESPPNTVTNRLGKLVNGVYKCDEALLLTLDVEGLSEHETGASEVDET